MSEHFDGSNEGHDEFGPGGPGGDHDAGHDAGHDEGPPADPGDEAAHHESPLFGPEDEHGEGHHDPLEGIHHEPGQDGPAHPAETEHELAHDQPGGDEPASPPGIGHPGLPAHILASSPGGTLFDPVPGAGHTSLDDVGPEPDGPALTDGEHYAAAWAHDDGTGMIHAIGAPAPAVDDPGAGPHPDAAVDAHVTELVYGGRAGLDEAAARLWRELAPGTPIPTDEQGATLPADGLLAELVKHVDDPVSRSVVDAALGDARR